MLPNALQTSATDHVPVLAAEVRELLAVQPVAGGEREELHEVGALAERPRAGRDRAPGDFDVEAAEQADRKSGAGAHEPEA